MKPPQNAPIAVEGLDQQREPRSFGVAAIGAATLLAAVLRFWGLGSVGLTHFDEGIYATASLWVTDAAGLAGIDPALIFYAPPGYPILAGALTLVVGFSDRVPALTSAILGVLTVPLVGIVGWKAGGRRVAVVAAVLAATSGPHLAFSRMGLTDVAYVLTLLLTIAAGGWFLKSPGWGRAIVLGLAVGVAQNVKYHGVLGGLAVGVAALSMVRERRGARWTWAARVFGLGVVALSVAIVLDWPWIRFVESHESYEGLLAHQRSYLTARSPMAWLEHWRLQVAGQAALAGRWGAIPMTASGAALAAAVGCWGGREKRGGMTARRLAGNLLIVAGVGLLWLVPGASWWVAASAIPRAFRRDAEPTLRVTASAWVIFAVLTPFYHPYARLWLPLQATGWILAGVVLDGWLRMQVGSEKLRDGRRDHWISSASIVVVLVIAASWFRGVAAPTELVEERRELRRVVDRFAAILGDVQGEVAVFARPAVAHYLASRHRIHSHWVHDREDLRSAVGFGSWLVLEPGMERGGSARNRVPSGWVEVASGRFHPGIVTRLDENPGAAFEGGPDDDGTSHDRELLLLRR